MPSFLPVQLSTHWVVAASATFLLKQLVCDFLLQTKWMALGKERPRGWLAPLLAHAGVHGAATAAIFAVFAPDLVWLGAVDFVIHCLIDRAKALVGRRYGLTQTNTFYWWLFGVDQFLHHATHFVFAMILIAVKSVG